MADTLPGKIKEEGHALLDNVYSAHVAIEQEIAGLKDAALAAGSIGTDGISQAHKAYREALIDLGKYVYDHQEVLRFV